MPCLTVTGLGGTEALCITYGSLFTRFSPLVLLPAIFAHQRAHARMAQLVDNRAVFSERFPAWLNEGLAVLFSEDPLYHHDDAICAGHDDRLLPAARVDWIADVSKRQAPLYSMVACRAKIRVSDRDG